MPTYYATAVTATLSTCALRPTLSNDLHLRPGGTQRANEEKVRNALSSAQKLPERPMGINLMEKGVVQFIGPDADMPFYVVEAGNLLDHRPSAINTLVELHDAPEDKPDKRAYHTLTSDSNESSLTSLTTTPTPPRHTFASSSPSKLFPSYSQAPPVPARMDSSPLPSKTLAAPSRLHQSDAQALVLDVHFSQKSFLLDIPRPQTTRGFHKGMKIEVFVNGQLADVCFVSANADRRRASRIVNDEKVCFAGLRIHRQVEKPWVYSSHEKHSPDAASDAETSWNTIRAAHTGEADLRNLNASADPAPSADFLKAVAKLDIPPWLKASCGMGVIDIVITVGEGRKHGADTPYILCPDRLDNRTHEKLEFAADSQAVEGSTIALAGPIAIPAALSEPKNATPSPSKIADFAMDLGLDIDQNITLLGSYENAHGSLGQSGRTLRQRLGDLKKMNERNQADELQRLKEEFGTGHVAKKIKLDPKSGVDFESFLTADGEAGHNGAVTKASAALNDRGLQGETSVESHGPLSPTESSTTWGKARRGITKAFSLAHSPVSVPVKPPKARGLAATPQRLKADSVIWGNNEITGPDQHDQQRTVAASLAVPGVKKTVKKRNRKDESMDEAIAAFEVPEACKGSCVGYDTDEGVVRQIGKARSGEFKEHSLLVGMSLHNLMILGQRSHALFEESCSAEGADPSSTSSVPSSCASSAAPPAATDHIWIGLNWLPMTSP